MRPGNGAVAFRIERIPIASPACEGFMTTNLAQHFRKQLDEIHAALVALSPLVADTPWREGGWTRKQIVGHLLDSAANNRQRFVRAAADGSFAGPNYAQDAWVAAHGYAGQPWDTLLLWWRWSTRFWRQLSTTFPRTGWKQAAG